jgi:hypothetical protein
LLRLSQANAPCCNPFPTIAHTAPETLALMTAAFDSVSRSVFGRMNGKEGARQTLALIILRQVKLRPRP